MWHVSSKWVIASSSQNQDSHLRCASLLMHSKLMYLGMYVRMHLCWTISAGVCRVWRTSKILLDLTARGFRLAAERSPQPGTGVCTLRKEAVHGVVCGGVGGGLTLWMVARFTPPHLGLDSSSQQQSLHAGTESAERGQTLQKRLVWLSRWQQGRICDWPGIGKKKNIHQDNWQYTVWSIWDKFLQYKARHCICRTWDMCLAQCLNSGKTSNSGFLSIFSSRWLSCRGSSWWEIVTRDKKTPSSHFKLCPDMYGPPPFTFPLLKKKYKVTYAYTKGYCKAIPSWVFPFFTSAAVEH